MHEQFDSRLWADHGHEITAAMNDFFRKIGDAFRKLHEIEFDAPWRRRQGMGRGSCARC